MDDCSSENAHRFFDMNDEYGEDASVDLFSHPLSIVIHLAQAFAQEQSTKQVVDLFVRHMHFKRKRNKMMIKGYTINEQFERREKLPKKKRDRDTLDTEFLIREEEKKEEKKQIKRCSKAPNFFLASNKFSNLRIVVSRIFLVEILKAHLLYDPLTDVLSQKHQPYDRSIGNRIKGVVVSIFIEGPCVQNGFQTPLDWKWELRRRSDLLDDVVLVSPTADQMFAVLRYCFPHFEALRAFEKMSDNDYHRRLQDGSIRSYEEPFCGRCGSELALLYSRVQVGDDKEGPHDDQFLCLYCTMLHNVKAPLIPLKPKTEISSIFRLLKAYHDIDISHRSTFIADRKWEVALLSQKHPRVQNFKTGFLESMTDNAVVDAAKRAAEETTKYTQRDKSANNFRMQRYTLLEGPASFFKTIISNLRAEFSPPSLCLQSEQICSDQNEGVTIYNDDARLKSATFSYNPSNTTSLLIPITVEYAPQATATWLLIPPFITDDVVKWVQTKHRQTYRLDFAEVEQVSDVFKDVIIITQKPGQVVTVPVGWGYFTFHNQPSIQLSFDWIERSTLHLSVLCYTHFWRTLADTSQKRDRIHIKFMSYALSKLHVPDPSPV